MYDRKFEQYSKEKETILKSLGKHSKTNDKYQELGALLFDVSQNAGELFVKAGVVQKRKMIGYALTNVKIEKWIAQLRIH